MGCHGSWISLRMAYVAGLLCLHAVLIAWVSWQNSPVSDEAAHMGAGVFAWHFGRSELYAVNPPLVRMIATLPVVCSHPQTDWRSYEKAEVSERVDDRPEFGTGHRFIKSNRDHVRRYFAWARWMCIPFSLAGGFFCWRWACDLYGERAGALALLLWCSSPNIIAWSATICPDTAATAMGVGSSFFFWNWLRKPDSLAALFAGLTLGLTQLTKMTWITLFAIWPLIWLLWIWAHRRDSKPQPWRQQFVQLAGILTLGLFVLNLGYAFHGTFTKLGDFTFVSRSLAGADSVVDGGQGGNRFATGWASKIPTPLPDNYIRGMDMQKLDFERGLPSYLFGQWKDRGWWYYYVVVAALRVPLGTWCLAILAKTVSLAPSKRKRPEQASSADDPELQSAAYTWRDECVLLLPAMVLFVFVSSQTGFSRHVRYALPALPFLFIWISRVASLKVRPRKVIATLVVSAVVWSVGSSLWIFPHSMSFFNELSGGPQNGGKYLLHSNLDWSQDVFYLDEWCEENPDAVPMCAIFANSYSRDLLGTRNVNRINGIVQHIPGVNLTPAEKASLQGPLPGWHAASVQQLYEPDGRNAWYLHFDPVGFVGYSFRIYHIALDDANHVRGTLKLPLLPSNWKASPADDPPDKETRSFVASMAQGMDTKAERPIRIALFRTNRHERFAGTPLKRFLNRSMPTCECCEVSADDIRSQGLDEADVVLFPGGKGSEMAQMLEEEGRQEVREFIRQGGGYVGICGGAFLATARYDWSLGLVNANSLTGSIDIPGEGTKPLASRGFGEVKMELTATGALLFGKHTGLLDVKYTGGPILSPAEVADLPRYANLAAYRTETWLYAVQRGTMIGTPAIIAAPYGKGRVILFSPHPESSEGLESMVPTAIKAVARRSQVREQPQRQGHSPAPTSRAGSP